MIRVKYFSYPFCEKIYTEIQNRIKYKRGSEEVRAVDNIMHKYTIQEAQKLIQEINKIDNQRILLEKLRKDKYNEYKKIIGI